MSRRDAAAPDDPWELMDVRQTARMLGVCEQTVRRMFHEGRLRHVRVGRTYRTTRGAVMRDLGMDWEDDG